MCRWQTSQHKNTPITYHSPGYMDIQTPTTILTGDGHRHHTTAQHKAVEQQHNGTVSTKCQMHLPKQPTGRERTNKTCSLNVIWLMAITHMHHFNLPDENLHAARFLCCEYCW